MRKNIDMLNGSLANKLLMFALPLAATGILQQLFNAADVAVVGNFVGSDAMAAVGNNAPLVNLLLNLFVGISLGTNVVISHAIGKKDNAILSRAVHTSVVISLIGGVIFAILGELLAKPAMAMLCVPDEVEPMAELYLRIYALGLPVIFLYDFESSIFRARGNTRTPLLVLTVSGVLNVLLNLLFVAVLRMTVDGVALATVISSAVSAIILFILLLRSKGADRIEIKKLKIHKDVLVQMLKIGVPAGVQGMVFSLSNICIQYAVNSLGTTIMAASSAAFNIDIFAFYVINAFGQACTTFTGQNYGANNIVRCKKVLKQCVGLSAVITALLSVIILIFGRNILSVFTSDEAVIEAGYTRLMFIFSMYLFSLLVEVMSGYLRGFGLSVIPAAATLIGICGIRITWIYTVFPHYNSFESILIIYPISMFATACVLWIIYAVKRKKLYSGMITETQTK